MISVRTKVANALESRAFAMCMAAPSKKIVMDCRPMQTSLGQGYTIKFKTYDFTTEKVYYKKDDCINAVYRWVLKHKYAVVL